MKSIYVYSVEFINKNTDKNSSGQDVLCYSLQEAKDKLDEIITQLDNTPINEDNKTAPEIIEKNKNKERIAWLRIFTGFTLPLLLIWIYDFFRNRYIRKKEILQTAKK